MTHFLERPLAVGEFILWVFVVSPLLSLVWWLLVEWFRVVFGEAK